MKKKILISLVLMVFELNISNAQTTFTFTANSATYTENGAPTTGNGAFYSYQPGYDPGYYVDNACSIVSNSDAQSPNQLGGFDPSVFDATTANPSRPGTIFYGGAIRTMYTGSPCAGASPSFGFTFNNGQVVDLTAVENQKLQFTYTNNTGTDLNVELQLFDKPGYNGKLTAIPLTFIADATTRTITIDFSSNIAPSADLSNIAQVSFVYPYSVKSPDFGLSFDDIRLGSTVTGVTKANEAIASSSVYPNPSLDVTTINLNLKTTSQVKITLADMMGKELKTIAEGEWLSLEQNFSVADLNKGIYTINYIVNGKTAKSELLMVK